MYILITARYRYFISVKDIKMSHFPAAKSTKKSRSSMNEIHLVSYKRSASLDPYRARGVCWTLLLHGKRCHISTLYSSRTHMELYTKWTQFKPTYKACSNWPLPLFWQSDVSEVFSQLCLIWLKRLKHGWYHHRNGPTQGDFLQYKAA